MSFELKALLPCRYLICVQTKTHISRKQKNSVRTNVGREPRASLLQVPMLSRSSLDKLEQLQILTASRQTVQSSVYYNSVPTVLFIVQFTNRGPQMPTISCFLSFAHFCLIFCRNCFASFALLNNSFRTTQHSNTHTLVKATRPDPMTSASWTVWPVKVAHNIWTSRRKTRSC